MNFLQIGHGVENMDHSVSGSLNLKKLDCALGRLQEAASEGGCSGKAQEG